MKTKLTPELQKNLIRYIQAGSHIVVACKAVGISEVTFYDWVKRGRAGEELYLKFLKSIKKAQAKTEIRNIAIVQKAAEKNWVAAMTWLERKYPQRWAKKDKLDVRTKKTVESRQVIEFRKEEKKLTSEQRMQLVRFTMKAIKEYSGTNGND